MLRGAATPLVKDEGEANRNALILRRRQARVSKDGRDEMD
jgi:hypothetical protein